MLAAAAGMLRVSQGHLACRPTVLSKVAAIGQTRWSMSETIERVGVVGCGLMGSGIAEVCARAGLDVMVREVDEAAAEGGRARLIKSLDRGLTAGKLTEAERDAAVSQAALHDRSSAIWPIASSSSRPSSRTRR